MPINHARRVIERYEDELAASTRDARNACVAVHRALKLAANEKDRHAYAAVVASLPQDEATLALWAAEHSRYLHDLHGMEMTPQAILTIWQKALRWLAEQEVPAAPIDMVRFTATWWQCEQHAAHLLMDLTDAQREAQAVAYAAWLSSDPSSRVVRVDEVRQAFADLIDDIREIEEWPDPEPFDAAAARENAADADELDAQVPDDELDDETRRARQIIRACRWADRQARRARAEAVVNHTRWQPVVVIESV